MTRYFKKDASDPGNPDDLANRIDPSSESYRVPEAEKDNAFSIIDPNDTSHYGHMMRIINTNDYRLHELEDKMATIESGATGDMTAAEILSELQSLSTPLALDVMYLDGNTYEEVIHNAVSATFSMAHPTVWGSTQQTQWVGDNLWLVDGITNPDVNRVRSAGIDRVLVCTKDHTPAKILVFNPWSNCIEETISINLADHGLPNGYMCTDVVNMGDYLIAIFADNAFDRIIVGTSGNIGYMCKIYPSYLYNGVMSGLPVITNMTALGYDDPSTIMACQWKDAADESSFIIGYCVGVGAADQAVVQKFASDFSVSWTTSLAAGNSWITGLDTNGNKCVCAIGLNPSGAQVDSFIYMLNPEDGTVINWGSAAYELVSNAPNDTMFMDLTYAGDCFYIVDYSNANAQQLYEYEFVNFCNGSPPTYQQRLAITRGGSVESPYGIEYDGHRSLFIAYSASGVGSVQKYKLIYDISTSNYILVSINLLEALEGLAGFSELPFICQTRQGIFSWGAKSSGSSTYVRNWGAQVRGE